MVVLHTYKNERNPIENEGARVLTNLYVVFFRRSRAANSKVSGGIMQSLSFIVWVLRLWSLIFVIFLFFVTKFSLLLPNFHRRAVRSRCQLHP